MAALNILGIGDEQQPGSLLGIPGAQALDISPPNADRPVEQRDALAGLYNNVTDYIKRERQRSSDMGLWNDETGLPTGKGLLSAAQQYGEGLLMGTTAPKGMPIYRGQYRGTEPSGNFFSEDREFAKQFTRQGLDEEVIVRNIDPAAVYHPSKPVYAGDEAAVDAAIAEAKAKGLRAVRLSEARGSAPGENEPASIFVFDKGALSSGPKPAFDWTPGGGTKTAQVGKTELTYGIDRTGATGEVVLVKTPPAERGQGEARRAMEEFVDHADTQGTTLFLNADPMDKGVSKSGLDRFYRSLGFVKNMGKRKDFRSTAEYVRQPVAGAQGSGE